MKNSGLETQTLIPIQNAIDGSAPEGIAGIIDIQLKQLRLNPWSYVIKNLKRPAHLKCGQGVLLHQYFLT